MIKNIVLSLYNNKLKLKIRPQYEQQKYSRKRQIQKLEWRLKRGTILLSFFRIIFVYNKITQILRVTKLNVQSWVFTKIFT